MIHVQITPYAYLTEAQNEELQWTVIGMSAEGEWDGECWDLYTDDKELGYFKEAVDSDWYDIEVMEDDDDC